MVECKRRGREANLGFKVARGWCVMNHRKTLGVILRLLSYHRAKHTLIELSLAKRRLASAEMALQ